MAIKFQKIEHGLSISVGDGAPTHTPSLGSPVHSAVAGDKYTDTVTGLFGLTQQLGFAVNYLLRTHKLEHLTRLY